LAAVEVTNSPAPGGDRQNIVDVPVQLTLNGVLAVKIPCLFPLAAVKVEVGLTVRR
jgi:hypothetical protein